MRIVWTTLFCLITFAGLGSAQITRLKAPRAGVAACKKRCSTQYNFCLKSATTKNARKGCLATRKTCKGQCGG
jgi:hypothetical protein